MRRIDAFARRARGLRRARAWTRRFGTAGAGALLIVVVMASPAWAHHPLLSGETVCTNGDHVVTWTIGNVTTSVSLTMTIASATAAIGATPYDVTGYSPTVEPNGPTTTATTIVPGDVTGTITLTVTGTWPDEVTETRTASVTLEQICIPDETTTTSTTESSTTTTTESTTTTTTEAPTTTIESTTSTSTTSIPGGTTVVTEGSTLVGSSTTVVTTPSSVGPLASTTTTTTLGPLPFTGSSTFPPLVGLMSLGAGGALWFMGRRRVARRA